MQRQQETGKLQPGLTGITRPGKIPASIAGFSSSLLKGDLNRPCVSGDRGISGLFFFGEIEKSNFI
jgi:hypothetical protein